MLSLPWIVLTLFGGSLIGSSIGLTVYKAKNIIRKWLCLLLLIFIGLWFSWIGLLQLMVIHYEANNGRIAPRVIEGWFLAVVLISVGLVYKEFFRLRKAAGKPMFEW